MASVAMAVGRMGSLSLSPAAALDSSSSRRSSSSSSSSGSSFADFSGLARVRPSAAASFSIARFACRVAPLRIEAREPTRKETVKVRHRRIRKKLNGTTERPRLAVFRSNKHLYAQVIDDTKQCTLAATSTLKKELREELKLASGPTVDSAKKVGEDIAKSCLEKGITKVAFDRGGFVYHGRIQALADAAREGGLIF